MYKVRLDCLSFECFVEVKKEFGIELRRFVVVKIVYKYCKFYTENVYQHITMET